MSITRHNHYVPIWYQRGFFEPGRNQLAYRDLQPETHRLPDGTTRLGRSRFTSSPKQCFVQRDLYTAALGDLLNDEIERRLFGATDTDGAPAIKAFMGEDVSAWHHHFQTLFRFIDIQKLRTPKGLDWLKTRYPRLSQNELMMEMQGIQAMHCTIWSEGVREIVSAADSDVKFIISDHPVTIYNHAVPPEDDGCHYPLDPSIALKASQTIYPLDRDHCLILTNLEYAKDRDAAPLEKRTFARNFRTSMVRSDAFVRTRRLSSDEVRQVNRIIKARARRYIAAGRQEWLDPEVGDVAPWMDLREVLRPPENGLWNFGGELYARFDDGHVHYQDVRRLRELDPLAAVQDGLVEGGEQGGQLNISKMAPNFEMALYIAQATGGSIVTDSPHRWREIQMAVARQGGGRPFGVPAFAQALAGAPLGFVNEIEDFALISATGAFDGYAPLFRDVFNYLAELEHRGAKPNWEGQLPGRLTRINRDAQKRLRKEVQSFTSGAVRGIFPAGGIQDNTVNRLLLMSSSEHHLPSVPMAFFIEAASN